MKYTIYQVRNKINNKIYVGKHQTDKPNDGYFGSGRGIKNAIRKYGRENFEKTLLFVFSTEQEMNEKEREIITEEFVNSCNTYNFGVGGEGGPHFKNRQHTKKTKEILSQKGKNRPPASLETRRKLSEKMKKRTYRPNRKGIKNPNYGKYYIKNPITHENKMVKNGEVVPDGWVKGRFINSKNMKIKAQERRGIPLSIKTKEKISNALMGNKNALKNKNCGAEVGGAPLVS